MRISVVLASVVLAALIGCSKARYVELHPFKSAVQVDFQDRSLLEARVREMPVYRGDRVKRVTEMFREAGCRDLRQEEVLGSPTPNVICRLPGRSDRTIIVGAHHVLAKGGKGVIDDWAGVTLLPALFASLRTRPRDHSYEFIAFASAAFEGDASYMHLRDKTPLERRKLVAMVWLDFLGMGEMATWHDRSDPNLRVDLSSVAKALDVEVAARNLRGAGSIHDGSRAFRWFDIPTIYLHSVDVDKQKILRDPHFDNDPDAIDYDAYFDSYRVLAVYLGYLDHTLAARKLQPGSAVRLRPPFDRRTQPARS